MENKWWKVISSIEYLTVKLHGLFSLQRTTLQFMFYILLLFCFVNPACWLLQQWNSVVNIDVACI